ncbi:MAG TPA: MTH1187 family thiamine-binding protein [Gemmatimonadaceae bacterium]
MLAELNVIPLGTGTSLSEELAEVLKIIDTSGLSYQLTPSGTCMEGEWDDIMRVARQCHEHARGVSPHVQTTITIEDEQGAHDKLTSNVASVEEKLGRKLKRVGATATSGRA